MAVVIDMETKNDKYIRNKKVKVLQRHGFSTGEIRGCDYLNEVLTSTILTL